MKRKIDSLRSQKWLLRNSLNNPSCISYVRNLCEVQFGFTDFDIKPFNNGENSLWIRYGLNLYVVAVDNEEICLVVFERKTDAKNKDKFYTLDKKFYNDSCWFRCMQWIKSKNLL